jgi:DNA transformation protein and related proteins
MSDNESLAEWLGEALEPLGVLRFKKMFGGIGVYLDSAFFALIAGGEVWLKADAVNAPEFDARDCPFFTFEMKDRTATMNYRRAPEDCLDDAEALRDWAMIAVGAARRAKQGSRK